MGRKPLSNLTIIDGNQVLFDPQPCASYVEGLVYLDHRYKLIFSSHHLLAFGI